MKVLVGDDSLTIRRILINILGTAGITDIDQAADGQQVVTAVGATTYDIVLLDWNMPNMLGIDALKTIRATGCKVPIIMVTTEAEKSRVLEALKSGANSYIIKPFKPDVILTKINDVLAQAGAQVS